MRTALTWASARRGRRLVIVFLALVGLADVVHAQLLFIDDYFSLNEVGAGPDTTIELRFDFRSSDRLKSPSDETFIPVAGPANSLAFGSLLKTFSSLDEAFDYLAGDWQGTFVTSPISGTEVSFDFQIDSLSPASVYRGRLENLSLQAGDQIRNGQTFMLSWDLPGGPGSGAYLNIVPQFSSGSGQSSRFFSRPNPNGNTHSGGSMGTGNDFFASDYRNEPGTSDFRFLTTYTAAPLPFDLVMTFGATTSLNSAVENAVDTDPNPFNGPPRVGLRYIRFADPFEVTIIRIPEPSPASLMAIVAVCVIAIHSLRTRREQAGCILPLHLSSVDYPAMTV